MVDVLNQALTNVIDRVTGPRVAAAGTIDVATILIFATLIDVVYQVVVFRWVYPGEALLVAVLLALVPYLIARGQPYRAPMAAAALELRNVPASHDSQFRHWLRRLVTMTTIVRLSVLTAALTCIATTASAQSTEPLEAGHGIAWGSLGLQGDLGGAVNSSGIGVVNGLRAEVNANAWAERYDTALIFRIGGAYNITTRSQVTATMTWDQAEADQTEIGLIGGQLLEGKFSDYQGWGIDFGYRYFFPTEYKAKPFVGGALGFQRLQDITLSLSSPVYTRDEIPFYDDSWVSGWRAGAGLLVDINERLGWQVTIDIKYSGVLSDQAGIGTVGFERINDVGNRWTVPIMGGVYVKF